MSDLRGALCAVALLAAACLPSAAAGQSPALAEDREERLARRVRDLEAAYLAADAAADRAEVDLRAQIGRQDTVEVGPLRIVTTGPQIAEARALWTQEWGRFEDIVGAQAEKLRPVTFVHHRRIFAFPFDVTADQIYTVEFRRPASDRAVAQGIRAVIGLAARRAVPDAIAEWSGYVPLGAVARPARRYELFVRTPEAVAVACAQGSTESCWTALGAIEEGVDPIAAWYTPSEMRATVLRASRDGLQLRPGYEQQCAAGSTAACGWIVPVARGPRGVIPYATSIRADLLWYAIERGGAGALDRLVAAVE